MVSDGVEWVGYVSCCFGGGFMLHQAMISNNYEKIRKQRCRTVFSPLPVIGVSSKCDCD